MLEQLQCAAEIVYIRFFILKSIIDPMIINV